MRKKGILLKSVFVMALILLAGAGMGKTTVQAAENTEKEVVVFRNGTEGEEVYTLTEEENADEISISPVLPQTNNYLQQKYESLNLLGNSTRAIIGTDTRTEVTNTWSYPYCAIARLTMTYEGVDRASYGTGFVIGSNVLATAGHCLIKVDDNGEKHYLETLKVEFGYNMTNGAYKTETEWTTCIYYGDYTTPAPETDYGFVILKNNVANSVGQFGIQSSASLNQSVTVTGYPGDKDDFSRRMYTGSGTISSITSDCIYYDVDTFGGQSGSPVYSMGTDGPYATAIHYGGNSASNVARRLDTQLIQWLFDNNYL